MHCPCTARALHLALPNAKMGMDMKTKVGPLPPGTPEQISKSLLTVRNDYYWGPTDRITAWPTDRRRSNFYIYIDNESLGPDGSTGVRNVPLQKWDTLGGFRVENVCY